MLCDSHIHVGQFYDIYTSPEELAEFLQSVGVDVVAVSSTTTCESNYIKAYNEIKTFKEKFPGITIPLLWVTPDLLNNDSLLDGIISSNFSWKGIKIHPQLAPSEWNADSPNYQKSIILANKIKVPILIHTGVVNNCHPLQMLPVFQEYPSQTFIMAHGRPIDETIFVLEQCANTYVDTAFMPIDHILKLVQKGYAKRILWGTDYPIIKFHDRNLDYKKDYYKQIEVLKSITNANDYEHITSSNMFELYNISQLYKV